MVKFFNRQVKLDLIYMLCLNILILSITFLLKDAYLSDPDRFYHYFMSNQYIQNFAPQKIQRIFGLTWDISFPEKEFFYHALTSMGFYLGKEAGLKTLSLLFLFASLNIWYLLLRQSFDSLTSSILVASLSMSPQFISRLVLIRPHTLAVFLFSLICLFSRKKMWRALFICHLFFSLSYHTIYIPLVFNFFLLFFHFADSRKWDFKPLFYGLSGLFTGLLLNPYFPGNLKMGLKHLWIAFEQLKQNDLAYGPELAMQSPLRTLILFTPFFILALFNLLSCWKHRKSEKHKILSLACSLAALSLFVSIRFLEYAPAVILFCLSFTAFSSINLKYIRYSSIAAGLFCLASFNHNRYLENIEYFKKQEVTYKSLLALPPKSENHRIYNCDWWEGQYALWYSKFKVLDVLDPSLLMAQPELFELSYQTKRGRNPNWHTDIREKLDAKYVICNSKRALMDQMLSSDKIVNKSLFRISKNLVLGIFELK